MESASKLSALAQSFGVGDAIKSWLGLFTSLFEANQIVIAETYMLELFLKLQNPENYLNVTSSL